MNSTNTYNIQLLKLSILLIGLLISININCQQNDITVHDPVAIKQNNSYYLFCTGMGIKVLTSKDMKTWDKLNPVFDEAPAWAKDAIPTFKNHIWAPDISYYNNKYYLFYSVSAFGKNTSCIGLAVSKTLDPEDPDYKWEDMGKVIQSVPGRDLWNAIDPNLAFDENGTPWLTFGSFWAGIKLVKLNNDLTAPAQPEEWYTIAKRLRAYDRDDPDPGEGAIEAPFIFKKNNKYYLFVSFDYCCRGENSTYKIMVGRSNNISGPYVDKEGVHMTSGGASLVLEGDEKWAGLGHNSVYNFNGTDYLIYHAYDVKDKGKPKLQIKKLNWDNDGWPIVITNKTN
ncbi:arabinan endo-1,5-alpha-L-arabinosidase [Bacteroidota bacterium]